MTIPDKAIAVLDGAGYTIDEEVDLEKVAQTGCDVILGLKGIGKGYLKKIAQALEEGQLISASEWLEGTVLKNTENIFEDDDEDDDEQEEDIDDDSSSDEEIDDEEVEASASFGTITEVREVNLTHMVPETEINQQDINAMQAYFHPVIGPNSLPLEVMQWILDNVGIEGLRNEILEKINSLGIQDRYDLNTDIERRLSKATQKIQLLKEVAIYNKFCASKECEHFFHQGYWDASAVVWIYRDAKKVNDVALMGDVDIRIEKSANRIMRMGYDIAHTTPEELREKLFGD